MWAVKLRPRLRTAVNLLEIHHWTTVCLPGVWTHLRRGRGWRLLWWRHRDHWGCESAHTHIHIHTCCVDLTVFISLRTTGGASSVTSWTPPCPETVSAAGHCITIGCRRTSSSLPRLILKPCPQSLMTNRQPKKLQVGFSFLLNSLSLNWVSCPFNNSEQDYKGLYVLVKFNRTGQKH